MLEKKAALADEQAEWLRFQLAHNGGWWEDAQSTIRTWLAHYNTINDDING